MKEFLGKTLIVITLILGGCRPNYNELNSAHVSSDMVLMSTTEHCKYYRVMDSRGTMGATYVYFCECEYGYSCGMTK
jgi:hypothetical protein